MKDVSGSITYKDREFKLAFNLNVMEAIQDKYGTLAKWSALVEPEDGEPNIKALKYGFTQMLNEALDIEGSGEQLTEKQVGRMLSDLGMQGVAGALKDTVVRSTESSEKNA